MRMNSARNRAAGAGRRGARLARRSHHAARAGPRWCVGARAAEAEVAVGVDPLEIGGDRVGEGFAEIVVAAGRDLGPERRRVAPGDVGEDVILLERVRQLADDQPAVLVGVGQGRTRRLAARRAAALDDLWFRCLGVGHAGDGGCGEQGVAASHGDSSLSTTDVVQSLYGG